MVSKKKILVNRNVNIKGTRYDSGREYEVDTGLAEWMVNHNIADYPTSDTPKAITECKHVETPKTAETKEPAEVLPSYEKLLALVGNHTIEVYGDYGTGKSRFVHAVATESQVLGKKVLYIDTEGSLDETHVSELENYEYIGDDLETLVRRVEKAKQEKSQYDLLIVDSVGLPVLNAYARWTLDKKLGAIQKLAPIMADTVRFARDGDGLSIVTNQRVSEFTRVSKKLDEDMPLAPFGGKIAFVPKLILRSEALTRDYQQTEFRLLTYKARNLPQNYEVARFTIDKTGVRIDWRI